MASLLSKLRMRSFHDPTAILTALPVSIVVVVGAGLSLRSHSLLRKDRELVVHSYQVLNASDEVLLHMEDAETGQRGFIITGNVAFLSPYEAALNVTVPEQMGRLGRLIDDRTSQRKRVTELRALTTEKFQELSTTIAIRKERGFEAAQTVVSQQAGKKAMDSIRIVTRDIQASEAQLLSERTTEVQKDERRIVAIAIATTFLSTLFRIGIAVWRRRVRAVREIG